ncbi:outer membrane lipid asymmetry maintenance protein MlaD [Pelagivirga sediminicola]|uniref:Outer membrane lipid asymmetry maintenance protein MlaD n=1 Tax=Pelagivirga sediminicola TaxID=2170575 RepID=A0A2T7G7R0_9RHOB|nr:outer membrane lipid asymmetry maintenance protein MlaD [Pelagivirga sediminicola]PVA10452.1 outer membrane lipid asymmetry maintenance protein MlaD [Pelagivirga sediminicola]
MAENKSEIIAGAVVVAVALGFVLYAGKLTGASAGTDSYELTASFRSADGITVGTDVRLAGVKVGRVTSMALDPATYRAGTTISVAKTIEVPDDSALAISSEGLLGGNYVEILPGGSPMYFEPGDQIEFTQGSISLVSLLMKFVGGDDSDKAAAE